MNASATQSQDAAKLFEKLVDGDEQACRDLVTEFLEGDAASLLSICEAFTEAFYRVGDAWECEQISIYREHIASQIGYRLLQDVRLSLASPAEGVRWRQFDGQSNCLVFWLGDCLSVIRVPVPLLFCPFRVTTA